MTCWREKIASASIFVVSGDVLDANAQESAKFDKARSEASTICDGLLDGQRFERIAGRAAADWSLGRNAGPPGVD